MIHGARFLSAVLSGFALVPKVFAPSDSSTNRGLITDNAFPPIVARFVSAVPRIPTDHASCWTAETARGLIIVPSGVPPSVNSTNSGLVAEDAFPPTVDIFVSTVPEISTAFETETLTVWSVGSTTGKDPADALPPSVIAVPLTVTMLLSDVPPVIVTSSGWSVARTTGKQAVASLGPSVIISPPTVDILVSTPPETATLTT